MTLSFTLFHRPNMIPGENIFSDARTIKYNYWPVIIGVYTYLHKVAVLSHQKSYNLDYWEYTK